MPFLPIPPPHHTLLFTDNRDIPTLLNLMCLWEQKAGPFPTSDLLEEGVPRDMPRFLTHLPSFIFPFLRMKKSHTTCVQFLPTPLNCVTTGRFINLPVPPISHLYCVNISSFYFKKLLSQFSQILHVKWLEEFLSIQNAMFEC